MEASEEMEHPDEPSLIVFIGDGDIGDDLRNALAAFPGRVETVGSVAEAARAAERGGLILMAPDASLLRKLARGLDAHGSSDGVSRSDVRARVPQPFTPHQLYEEARGYVAAALTAVRDEAEPDIDQGRLIAERMHTDLLRDNGLVNRSLEPHDVYDLASHSVNVAVLSGKIALGMVSGVEDAVDVIHAGLLHDIGMAILPETLLRTHGAWSDRERETLRQHPVRGAEVLERFAPRLEWLRRAVLQEHERAQGQGYPFGLQGHQVDPIARILGVADVFEALSHPRTYRSPYTALEALEMIVGMQEAYFSPRVVAALVNEISAFPLDSYVQLSTGEIARVVATNPSNMLRPTVELVWDADWKPVDSPFTVELAERPEVTVARALLEAELPIS
jgi:HD-GYP domain-containing protein (c-di-GMP phosphodiesterase class II)